MTGRWPAIPYADWQESCTALHLWAQIAGKYRIAHTPWVNHSWHATLYVTPRGLTTGPVPDPGGTVSLGFDFCDHRFVAEAAGGRREAFALREMSVAEFFARAKAAIAAVGGSPHLHGTPNELADPVPFAEDEARRPYDRKAVERYHQALLDASRVFAAFRTSFLGKVSPVHLFWGAFDLAVTRFSGRTAPLHPGGVPGLPDAVTREAYSHEVCSAGFWPGGFGVEEATFYSYAYPTPDGFPSRRLEPEVARWEDRLGEFLLPYETVRTSPDPDRTLLQFLHSAWRAAAETGDWPVDGLECEPGLPRVPRVVTDAG